MKYILKKDLPFAKAGATIYNYLGDPFNEANMDCFIKPEWRYKKTYSTAVNGMVFIGIDQDLIHEGWIEEVKPREVWVLIQNNEVRTAYDYEEKDQCYTPYKKDLRLFREVID